MPGALPTESEDSINGYYETPLLLVHQFGFSIPPWATILSIEVSWSVHGWVTGPDPHNFHRVGLYLTNVSSIVDASPGPTDTWPRGVDWVIRGRYNWTANKTLPSPLQVNSPVFGAVVSGNTSDCEAAFGAQECGFYVQSATMRVTYNVMTTTAIVAINATTKSFATTTTTAGDVKSVSEEDTNNDETQWPIFLVAGLGVFACVLSVIALTLVFRRRQRREALDDAGFVDVSSTSTRGESTRIEEAERLNDVTVGKKIGQGNFGSVFLGEWSGLPVAIKQITSGNISELQSEFSVLSSLNHPSIVRYYGLVDLGPEYNGGQGIVLEYCAKGGLDEFLKSSDFPPRQLLEISLGMARGLQYLSNKSVLHRDLGRSFVSGIELPHSMLFSIPTFRGTLTDVSTTAARNVLVCDDGSCKLSDFGLARALQEDESAYTVTSTLPVRWTAPEGKQLAPISFVSGFLLLILKFCKKCATRRRATSMR
jgi:Protein tyrosine and serine/threonine kinase